LATRMTRDKSIRRTWMQKEALKESNLVFDHAGRAHVRMDCVL